MGSFDPTTWHEFFTVVGGGAAALIGLLFVSLSIQREIIAADPVLRFRARAVIWSLTAIFMRSGLVLMGGQSARAIAIELIVVCLFVLVPGGSRAVQMSRHAHFTRDYWMRIGGLIGCHLVEIAGATWLFLGSSLGMYVVGVAIVANFFFGISGSWLLLMQPEDARRASRSPRQPSGSRVSR